MKANKIYIKKKLSWYMSWDAILFEGSEEASDEKGINFLKGK